MTKLLLALVAVTTFAAGDVTGEWEIYLYTTFTGDPGQAECTLRQDGRKLTGDCPVELAGDVDGRRVTFQMSPPGPNGQKVSVDFVGDLDERETTITGTWRAIKPPDDMAVKEGKFRLTKH